MNEIYQRLGSPTPSFFKKLRKYAAILGTVAGVLMAAPITLPAIIVSAIPTVLWVTGSVVTVTSLTKETPTNENKT